MPARGSRLERVHGGGGRAVLVTVAPVEVEAAAVEAAAARVAAVAVTELQTDQIPISPRVR